MKVLTKIDECRKTAEDDRKKGLTIGLVPTMGYLHEGHLSLAREAVRQCQKVFMTVFVNPAQFGPSEDLGKYPRDLKRDKVLAEKAGIDYIFCPEEGEMYGKNHLTYVYVEKLSEIMCGAHRPGHFRGVTTVVLKLFNIIVAHKAYFGRKDYQQLAVIKKMVEDLNINMEIVDCPTVREEDGLALSSRNKYLSRRERENAPVIYRVLKEAETKFISGEKEPGTIKKEALQKLRGNPYIKRIDYFDIRDAATLDEVNTARTPGNTVIATAVIIGETRLIDNVVIYKKK